MSETTTSVPLKTAACSATWDLIEQLVQLESSKNRLHLEYMGKAMPADVYLRFQNLRDERIPALQAQLRADLAGPSRVCDSMQTGDSCKPNAAVTGAPDQPPVEFARAYADQLMLRCLVPVEPTPQAQPADALDADQPEPADLWYLQDTRGYVGNDVLWWAKDGNGYTTDISKAHAYTRDEAFQQAAMRGTNRAWPKAYIDGKTRPAVDMQYIDHQAAMAAAQEGGNVSAGKDGAA